MITDPTYLLYASCIPVSGARHKIICDLQRNGYVRIPDGLFEIVTEHRGKSQAAIKAAYDHQYDAVIDGYFEMLVKHEFAFACDDPELFPTLDLQWQSPFPVYNAILDRGKNSTYNLHQAIHQLSEISCKYLQIRFFAPVSREKIQEMLDYFETIRSATISIELVVPAAPELDTGMARDFLAVYNRLNKVTLHGSAGAFNIEEVRSKRFLIQMPEKIDSASHCGVIDPGFFSINIKSFTEARKFNSCLNGKISVDQEGYIRNCPSMPKDFGHLSEVSLAEAANHPEFRASWSITKDQVEVCRDCEFRYICTDCRAFTQGGKADGKPLKCGYDPYHGTWSDTAPSNPLRTSVRARKNKAVITSPA